MNYSKTKTGDGSPRESAAVHEREDVYYTVDEAARKLNVSTKTIMRWRKAGLRSETRLIESRYRVVIWKRDLERFVTENPQRVEKGTRFSQMSDEQRQEIIERAKRMAVAGRGLTEVIRRLADSTGRSTETIRYTLKNYDQHHPQEAIFPKYQRSLTLEEKCELLDAYQNGVSIDELAVRFERTRTSIYRILADIRWQQIMALPLEFILPEEVRQIQPGSEEENLVLAEIPKGEAKARRMRAPAGLPAYLASLYTVPLLTFEQEQHLFRKMNYLKYRAAELRDTLDSKHLLSRVMDQIERLNDAATEAKNQIVTANLRLVVSIAKRHTQPNSTLFDLISDGNMSLIRAVEKFDYSRQNRFSTYASWAIMKNYARAISDEQFYRSKFLALENDANVEREKDETDPAEMEAYQARQEKRVAALLKTLTPREQQILIRRFGLDRNREPLTLKQVGQEMGVTKERIRQIEIQALEKLRKLGGM